MRRCVKSSVVYIDPDQPRGAFRLLAPLAASPQNRRYRCCAVRDRTLIRARFRRCHDQVSCFSYAESKRHDTCSSSGCDLSSVQYRCNFVG
jgi:hypothetical protein